MARITEIEKRLSDIKSELAKADALEMDKLEKEVVTLKEERNAIRLEAEKRTALLKSITDGEITGKEITTPHSEEKRGKAMENIEKRAKAFRETNRMNIDTTEARSLLLSTGKIATPGKVSGVTDGFNEVSSIVDLVTVENCEGMSSDKVAYMNTSATANDGTADGTVGADGTPTFDFVTIQPQTKDVVCYVSKQIRKQTPLNYEEKVRKSAIDALRKKASKLIVDGVYSSVLADEIISITEIDDKTLRTIAMNYGGDENVVGNATLVLNKKDLVAFGDVRGEHDKKPVYEITPNVMNANIGTIKDGGLVVPYIINSNCVALTGTVNTITTKTKPTMFYGQLSNFKLDMFGDYEINASDDYKFAEGLLTIKGEVDLGGAVIVKGGFVKVSLPKKAAQ